MPNAALRLLRSTRVTLADEPPPRPTLARAAHLTLDRVVGFAHDDADVGLAERWAERAEPFDRTIRLPFPPESPASGVGERGFHPCVWYRLELSAADLAAAGHAPGRRLLLHLGAVDFEATVFVDGRLVGRHTGGQAAFVLDVTDALAEGDAHVVVVRAHDDPLDGRQPRGKQDWRAEPHFIWYHRTTGIWRTVWLESVPPLFVERLVWRTDLAAGGVRAHVELNRRPEAPVELDLAIARDGEPVAALTVTVADRVAAPLVQLPGLANLVDRENLLWTPEHPVLFDAALVLHGPRGRDEVASYLGVREVGVGRHHLLLNDRPLPLRSVLEQGYWPESHLAAPSPAALRAEVRLILDLGFNSVRVHQKVEDPRFLYWADRLGLTVWAEQGAAYAFDSFTIARVVAEWTEIVRAQESHPSVIAWVPLNESWGVTDLGRDRAQAALARALADLTRALDPTRPVISNDGWEHVDSDLLTVHDYEGRRDVLAARYTPAGLAELAPVGPAGRPLTVGDRQRPDVPVLVTECGGVEFAPDRDADTWGYTTAVDADDLTRRIRAVVEPLRAARLLGGFCWTQLTDTGQEANGLCDARRTPKLPAATLRALFGA